MYLGPKRPVRTKRQLLRRIPAFAACSDRELGEIDRLVDDWTVDAGTVLMREGSRGHEAFMIIDGRASVAIDGEVLTELGPGEFLGELSMVDHEPRTATVTAVTEMRLLVVGPAEFDDFVALPAVSRELTRELAQRLRRADARIT